MAAVPGHGRSSLPLSTSLHHRVVVVGAGAAALGAITELNKEGITDILVLEGGSRLGGRVHSLYPSLQPGAPVELGAQWVHGEQGNELHRQVSLVAPELLSAEYSTDGDGIFLLSDGTEVPKSVVKEVLDYCQECEALLEQQQQLPLLSQEGKEEPPCQQPFRPNVAAVFIDNKQWDALIQSKPEHLRPIYQALFDWNVKWYLADNACQDLHDLSVLHWARYKYCQGEFNINPSKGMLEIIQCLYRQRQATIHFNSRVKSIRYATSVRYIDGHLYDCDTMAPAVTLICSDGKVVGADAVIVTCSIGHLQQNPELFNPPLPQPLSQAINSMGFGTMNKIILEYREPWWQRYNGQSLQFVWQLDNTNVSDRKWEQFLTGFDVTHGSVPRLTGWVGGKGALLLESCPEQEVARTCTDLLRRFLARDDIPPPCAVYRSQWNQNPLFLGTYSHPSVKFEKNRCSTEHLNTPVRATLKNHHPNQQLPLVTMAGEANSYHFFSTVHGALENGMQQAKHVVQASKLLDSLVPSKL